MKERNQGKFPGSSRGSELLRCADDLEDIQHAIAKLSVEDCTKLRLWLNDFVARHAEHREPETKASKLGRLAGRAVADFRKRMREP